MAFFGLMMSSTALLLSAKACPQNGETADGGRPGTEVPRLRTDETKGERGRAYLESARAWAKKEEWGSAFHQYGKAWESGESDALIEMGRLQLALRRYSDAVGTFLRYLEKHPQSKDGWIALLEASIGIGNERGAADCIRQLGMAERALFDAADWAVLAKGHLLLDDARKAEKCFKRAKKCLRKAGFDMDDAKIPDGILGHMALRLADASSDGDFEAMERVCGEIGVLASALAGHPDMPIMLMWMNRFYDDCKMARGKAPIWLLDAVLDVAGNVVGEYSTR